MKSISFREFRLLNRTNTPSNERREITQEAKKQVDAKSDPYEMEKVLSARIKSLDMNFEASSSEASKAADKLEADISELLSTAMKSAVGSKDFERASQLKNTLKRLKDELKKVREGNFNANYAVDKIGGKIGEILYIGGDEFRKALQSPLSEGGYGLTINSGSIRIEGGPSLDFDDNNKALTVMQGSFHQPGIHMVCENKDGTKDAVILVYDEDPSTGRKIFREAVEFNPDMTLRYGTTFAKRDI